MLPYIHKHLKDAKKTGDLNPKTLKRLFYDKYYTVLTKLKLNQAGLEARKDWLKSNSRCSEVLDSEFYYQVLPSLDLAVFDVKQDFLRLRQIKGVDFSPPDSRYLNLVSIGFNVPRT